ncbi:MAG: hypothetical protein AB4080_10655 [Trichodesmium sp.]
MVNQNNDIFTQARQGSVAAIISILNQELATLGIRIRAIFSDGVLQVLCEAPEVEQLEKSNLVEQLRETLEKISPRNIQQVKINSRIIQEQKLLWLEDITRESENQFLWSQKITLAKPNIFQQIANIFQKNEPKSTKIPLYKSVYSRGMQKPNQFQPDVIGIFFLSLLMLTLGLLINRWVNFSEREVIVASENTVSQSPSPTTQKSPENNDDQSKVAFTQAVRLAQKAVADGKIAQSQEEWVAIAKTWQQAAELMASVAPSYSKYDVAVNRTELYQKYSNVAKKEAEKR